MKHNREFIPLNLYGTLNTSIPVEVLPLGAYATLTNFYPKDNVLKKRDGCSALGAAISSGTYTGLHSVRVGSADVLFRMYNDTGNKIEYYNTSTSTWTSVTTGLTNSDSVTWDLCKYYYTSSGTPYEATIITNNVNIPGVYYNSTYAALNTLVATGTKYPSKAKFVEELDGYLICFNIVEADTSSVTRGNRIRWCDVYDITTWDDDSYQDILGVGEIKGVIKFNHALYIFTSRSVIMMSPTGDLDVPFSFANDIVPFGTDFHNTLLDIKNRVIYLGVDNTIRSFDGFKSIVLSESVASYFSTLPSNSWAAFDEADAQYLIYTTSGLLSLDIGTSASAEVQQVNYGLETYTTATPTFLTTYNGVPYGIQGNYVVKLHDSSATTDVGDVAIASSLLSGYISLPPRQETKIGKVRLFGVDTSGTAANTTLTIYGYGPTTTTSLATANSVTGIDLEVNKWAKFIQFGITHSAAQSIRLSKLEIELLNQRIY